MTDKNFEIEILDLHWIKNVDDPNDLCAHGHLYLKIGNQIISDKETNDWTLSSTALSLLRTIENDYEKDNYSNQLLPHCGFFIIANDNEESVTVQGCNIGIDWKIIHTIDNQVRYILENESEISMDTSNYRSIVFDFADQVEFFLIVVNQNNSN